MSRREQRVASLASEDSTIAEVDLGAGPFQSSTPLPWRYVQAFESMPGIKRISANHLWHTEEYFSKAEQAYVSYTPVTATYEIEPQAAELLLQTNDNQRVMVKQGKKQLTRAANRGLWRFIGDTIKLSPDGELLDGQHRLTAVADSGVALRFHVVMGIPAELYSFMDVSRSRKIKDAVAGAGAINSKGNQALSQLLWRIVHGVEIYGEAITASSVMALPADLSKVAGVPGQKEEAIPQEGLEMYLLFQDEDGSDPFNVHVINGNSTRSETGLHASASAMMSLVYSLTEGPELNDLFWEGVTRGYGLTDDDPRNRLRKFAQRSSRAQGPYVKVRGLRALQSMAWIQLAWEQFIAGVTPGSFQGPKHESKKVEVALELVRQVVKEREELKG
jgi:hypothetical protein|tara:strand:- start:12895 stop:14061 length:1167 start_codon:yes stop_codon:yes gene_type:complete